MLQPRTHYEQVPLEIVRKIVEQQIRGDSTIEQDQGTMKKTLDEDPNDGEQQQWGKFPAHFVKGSLKEL